jgi:hypothetical protein
MLACRIVQSPGVKSSRTAAGFRLLHIYYYTFINSALQFAMKYDVAAVMQVWLEGTAAAAARVENG